MAAAGLQRRDTYVACHALQTLLAGSVGMHRSDWARSHPSLGLACMLKCTSKLLLLQYA